MLERNQSLVQYINNIASLQGLVFQWPWIPHNTTRWRWRAYDGSGDGAAGPIWKPRPEKDTETRKHEHRWTSLNGSWQLLQEAKQGQGAKQWQDAARNFEPWLTPNLATTFRADKCAMMRESRRFFTTSLCVHISWQTCLLWFLWMFPRFSSRILHRRVQSSWEEC